MLQTKHRSKATLHAAMDLHQMPKQASLPHGAPKSIQGNPGLGIALLSVLPSTGQFTALHTLSVDCASKACGDFEALPLLTHLRRLHLAQFSFADEAFREGLGRCWKLQALHIESQQVRGWARAAAGSCMSKFDMCMGGPGPLLEVEGPAR